MSVLGQRIEFPLNYHLKRVFNYFLNETRANLSKDSHFIDLFLNLAFPTAAGQRKITIARLEINSLTRDVYDIAAKVLIIVRKHFCRPSCLHV